MPDKKIAVYNTRWLRRQTPWQYVRNVENLERWENSSADYRVAVHGQQELDEITFRAAGADRMLDFREQTENGNLARLIRLCALHAIEHRYKAMILLDDDAWIDQIEFTMDKTLRLINDENLGAGGPYNDYWSFVKWHGSDKGKDYMPKNSSPWATNGCQIYSVAMLKDTRDMWDPLYQKLAWRSDFQLFMMADSYDYRCLEFLSPKYTHSTSQGTDHRSITEDWFHKRIRQIDNDYRVSIDCFKANDMEKYLGDVDKLKTQEFKACCKTAMKSPDHESWMVQPVPRKPAMDGIFRTILGSSNV